MNKSGRRLVEKFNIVIFTELILLLAACLYFALYKKKTVDPTESLKGQWKVTEFLTCKSYLVASYSYYEPFLGRSINIMPDQIIESIHYWPGDVEYFYFPYDEVVVEDIDATEYGGKNHMLKPWFEKYDGQKMTQFIYCGAPDYKVSFFETEQGEMICQYLCNYYYMEPYVEANTDLKPEQLFGEWKVERLVSYHDGWRGNNVMYPEAKRLYEDLEPYTEEEGANFYPQEYYDMIFTIDEEFVSLYGEAECLAEHDIIGFDSQIHNTHEYQMEKGIHDELGITNDKIQVIEVIFADEEKEGLLDGEIVIIDDKRIIMKIDQGWFLLVNSLMEY